VVYETIKQEGFLIVILGRQQLFAENTLTVVLPVLRRRDSLMFANVARLWSTVLAANIAGALLFAWVGARTSIFSPETRAAMSTLGVHAMEPAIVTVFLTGIFAGWLIALMVNPVFSSGPDRQHHRRRDAGGRGRTRRSPPGRIELNHVARVE